MFCSPPGRTSGPTRRWTCQDPSPRLSSNYSLSAKKHPLFVFTSAPPATGQLLSRLITQPRDWLGLGVNSSQTISEDAADEKERIPHDEQTHGRDINDADENARPRAKWTKSYTDDSDSQAENERRKIACPGKHTGGPSREKQINGSKNRRQQLCAKQCQKPTAARWTRHEKNDNQCDCDYRGNTRQPVKENEVQRRSDQSFDALAHDG